MNPILFVARASPCFVRGGRRSTALFVETEHDKRRLRGLVHASEERHRRGWRGTV